YWDTDIKSIQKELQNMQYSSIPFHPDFLLTKAQTKKPNTGKDVVVITDAINLDNRNISRFKADSPTYFIVPEAENKNNIAIDSVFITQNLDNFYEIAVRLKSYGDNAEDLPIALHNGKQLTAKTVVKFGEEETNTINFTIPKKEFHGYSTITDNTLAYYNTYYFSITRPEKANILAIGEASKTNFLGS